MSTPRAGIPEESGVPRKVTTVILTDDEAKMIVWALESAYEEGYSVENHQLAERINSLAELKIQL